MRALSGIFIPSQVRFPHGEIEPLGSRKEGPGKSRRTFEDLSSLVYCPSLKLSMSKPSNLNGKHANNSECGHGSNFDKSTLCACNVDFFASRIEWSCRLGSHGANLLLMWSQNVGLTCSPALKRSSLQPLLRSVIRRAKNNFFQTGEVVATRFSDGGRGNTLRAD